MVCSGDACSFGRGGSLDFLAAVKKGYGPAVELAAKHEPYYQGRLYSEMQRLEAGRRLIEFGMQAELQNYSPDVERLQLQQAFAQVCQVDFRSFGRGHWFLTREQSNTLIDILIGLEITPPPTMHNRAVAVAPLWGDLHTISMLYVVAKNMDTFKVVPIHDYRCHWFGLSQMHPTCSSVDSYTEYLEAMDREESYRLHNSFRFPSQAHVVPESETSGWQPQDLKFHSREERWFQALPKWSYISGFEDATFVGLEDGEERSLGQLMEDLLRSSLHTGFDRFTDLCGAMLLDKTTRAQLVDLSQQLPNQQHAERLRALLSRKVLEQGESGIFYECTDGYELHTKKQVKRITNFTMELSSITCFSEHSDLYYSGVVQSGRLTIPFELPSRQMDNPSQFCNHLRSLQLLGPGGTSNDDELITVYFSEPFKRILELLRSKASALPRSRGVRALGWNAKHDMFVTPLALVDKDGIKTGVRYHADPAGEHVCYSSDAPPPSDLGDMPELDPYLAELVSALVAQVVRCHHGLLVRPMALQNNDATRDRGLRLFRGFGQTGPMRLTVFNERNVYLNRGMPCLFASMNDLQANHSKYRIAGARLADKGLDLGRFQESELEAVERVLPALVLEVCRRLLSGQGVGFKERRSIRPQSAMAEEGAEMIRREFWPRWPEASVSWVAIDRMLESREKEFKKLARVNEQKDRVVVPDAVWSGLPFDQSDLLIELGLTCDVVEAGEAAVEVDRGSMYRLLDAFYGETPRLQALSSV